LAGCRWSAASPYRFLRRPSDARLGRAPQGWEAGRWCITTCCFLASAAKKSISLVEHNTLATARGAANAPA